MRSLQTTNVSYGLQKIPVRIGTLVKETETGLSGCCADPNCLGDTGSKTYCKKCETIYESRTEIRKAYKFDDDEKMVLSQEQIDSLKDFDSQILVLGTIPQEQVDIRTVIGGYYLAPAKSKKKNDYEKLFLVLFEGLKNSKKAIVCKYAIRTKQKLGILVPYENETTKTIIIKQIAYHDELREFDEKFTTELKKEEIEMGDNFLNSLKEIDPKSIENDYVAKLEEYLKGEPMEIEVKETESNMDFFKA